MTDRPILFSAPMVRAMLDGSKTQTRRVVKPTRSRPVDFLGGGSVGGADWNNPECWGYEHHDSGKWVLLKSDLADIDSHRYPCPYGAVGDRLWVREAWRTAVGLMDGQPPRNLSPRNSLIRYEVDGANRNSATFSPGKLRPGMFMPRWASRITLEVTGVRVERLQDISEADARAEGARECDPVSGREVLLAGTSQRGSYVLHYRDIWESINGPGSWDLNPWVWRIEFKVITP